MINIQLPRWLVPCVVVVSMCLVGCSAALLSPDDTSPSAIPTFSPIVVSPQSSPEPQICTPTPGPVPATHTPCPTQTPMPTLVPTLTADEERAFVVEMLETNGGCELPCWWGVTPGETTWQAVKDQFGLYYGHGDTRSDGTVYHYGPTYGLSPERTWNYYIAHTFVERDGIVQSIQVMSEVNRNAQAGHSAQDWHHYSLDQILAHYGQPSQVWIAFVPVIEIGSSPYYDITLVYEHFGFRILYSGAAVQDDAVMRTCLRFEQVTRILLNLQTSPMEPTMLEGHWLSLEEATGMDVETFYRTFRNANSDVCLESPAEMWP